MESLSLRIIRIEHCGCVVRIDPSAPACAGVFGEGKTNYGPEGKTEQIDRHEMPTTLIDFLVSGEV